MASPQIVSAAQERAFAEFVESRGDKPFRRQDLSTVLYPHTRPRARNTADTLAGIFIQRLQSTSKLVKAGHVHWRLVVPVERKLQSGRIVPELAETQSLTLNTRCPLKWAAIDLETGEIYAGDPDGWKRASETVRAEAAAIVQGSGK